MSRTTLHLPALLIGSLFLGACAGEDQAAPTAELPIELARGDAAALARVEVALEHLAGGRRPDALATLEACLDAHPGSLEANLEYARLAATSGHTAPALATYERLHAADPTDDGVARGLARLALFLGREDLAGRAADVLAADASSSAADLALAAEVALAAGDVPLARSRAEAAVERDPMDPAAHHQLALAMLEELDDTLATGPVQNTLRVAVHLDPGRTEARHLLATLLMQVGKEELGRGLLDANALIAELGSAEYAALGPRPRMKRAREVADDLPTWSRPALEIARAQLALGQAAKAEETLVGAMDLRPRSLELYKLRYAAALARADAKAADNWLERWNLKREQDG